MSRPARLTAGIALVRRSGPGPELLLVHPGGPFWRNKDEHGWSIPKGEVDDPLAPDDLTAAAQLEATARREFTEETGHAVPPGHLVPLPSFALGSGKRLQAYLLEGEVDAATIRSNLVELEWPPRSGRTQTFPEVDRADWFDLDEARTRLHKGQVALVDLIEEALTTDVG